MKKVKRRYYENAVIEHLSPEELEKLADAQLAIEAVSRLKRELIDEILGRPWEPEKPQELIAKLKDGMHEAIGVPLEQVDEMVLKIQEGRCGEVQSFRRATASRWQRGACYATRRIRQITCKRGTLAAKRGPPGGRWRRQSAASL